MKTTVLGEIAKMSRIRGYLNQTLMVILINVPTVSSGLAMGWVSVASGEGSEEGVGGGGGAALVGAAAVTFLASLVAVPLCARALAAGRKLAVITTSAAFVVCWSLKLVGDGWWVVAARVAAGVGGTGAWAVAPLLAREMCTRRARGAAVAALVVAHNLGLLLMYLAADAGVPHRTVLWWCLGLSACHCGVFLFVPESPSYLAANGKNEEARAALAWLRGVNPEEPALARELAALPPPEEPMHSPIQLIREMLSDRRRRRAFTISAIAVIGQEACGVLALLQFAERVFVEARADSPPTGTTVSPARYAVVLGAAQLAASIAALYLVERIGRRPLLVWTGLTTGLLLACGAGAMVGCAGRGWAAAALAGAVAADSAGLQPAPYALLADMFHYRYRGCALMLVTAGACIGNALEVVVFPCVWASAGAAGKGAARALALAAALTLAYAAFAVVYVPETRGKTPEQIYDAMWPDETVCDSVAVTKQQCSKETVCTYM